MTILVDLTKTGNSNVHLSLPIEAVQEAMRGRVHELDAKLEGLNHYIHENPELAYKEFKACDAICNLMEELGFEVTRQAYGLQTAFEVISGHGGRMINLNAEYDALPGIGHACGHNLIATAAVTSFVALAHALKRFGVEGRVQLLGTPAEEDGGGKIDLLNAGAYKTVDASLMMHPMSDAEYSGQNALGSASFTSVASHTTQGIYTGVGSHAGATPWEGINALDAVVSTYVNISLLRQQMKPEERVHGAIVEAPKRNSNSIPAHAGIEYTARSTTIRGARELGVKVRRCMEAGALATGCKLEITETRGYADLRRNDALCGSYQKNMEANGVKVSKSQGYVAASTDQGDVSYALPALHAIVGIPVSDGSQNHTPGFTKAAGGKVAYTRAVTSGIALAMTGWEVLMNDTLYEEVKQDFENDRKSR